MNWNRLKMNKVIAIGALALTAQACIDTDKANDQSVLSNDGTQAFPVNPQSTTGFGAPIPDFIDFDALSVFSAEQGLERFSIQTKKEGNKVYLTTGPGEDNLGLLQHEYRQLFSTAENPDVEEVLGENGEVSQIRADVTSAIPDHFMKIYGMQTITNGPNCYGTAFYSKGWTPTPKYYFDAEVEYLMKESGLCRKKDLSVHGEYIQKGDFVVFYHKRFEANRGFQGWITEPMHMAYAIADGGHWFLNKSMPDYRARPGLFSDQMLYEHIFPINEDCRGLGNEPADQDCHREASSGTSLTEPWWTEVYSCQDAPNGIPTSTAGFANKNELHAKWLVELDRYDQNMYDAAMGNSENFDEIIRSGLSLKVPQITSGDRDHPEYNASFYDRRYEARAATTTFRSAFSFIVPFPGQEVNLTANNSALNIEFFAPVPRILQEGDNDYLWLEYRLDQGDKTWLPVQWDFTERQVNVSVPQSLAAGEHRVQLRLRDHAGAGTGPSDWFTVVVP